MDTETERRCPCCGGTLRYAFTEDLQLGKASLLRGVWPNIAAGALRAAVYCCPECGKLEFFMVGGEEDSGGLPQVTCPVCGRRHDFDYPRCPYCKHPR